MPNRIIKESIWTSPNLNMLSPLAERHFYRLLPLPDDFGCFESTSLVVKGKCYPLQPQIKTSEIEKWQQKMVENGILHLWEADGRQFGQFVNWDKHQRVRSLHQRKTPIPPTFDDTCRQVPTNDGLNPNLNPNPNLKKDMRHSDAEFSLFWKEYPIKKEKPKALKQWEKTKPNVDTLLTALRKQIRYKKECDGNGKFCPEFPFAEKWIKNRRWEDEVTENKSDDAYSHLEVIHGKPD